MEPSSPLHYTPIKDGQTRILCLQPGEPGSPLTARFEVVDLESARKAQPDLHLCDPEHLDFDETQTVLRRARKLLTQHQEGHAELDRTCSEVQALQRELRDLLSQRRTLEQTLHQDSPVSAQSGSAEALKSLSVENANLAKLADELFLLRVGDVDKFAQRYPLETYTSLAKISRLLVELSQTKRDDMVRHAASMGAFEALSYAWGTLDFDKQLHVEHCQQAVPITTSAFDALQHLRYPDQERRLWIDVLCINQFDAHERSHHISNMCQIYSAAARTIVWLGKAETSICLAYEVLHAHLSTHTYNLGRDSVEPGLPFHVVHAMNSFEHCTSCGEVVPNADNKPKLGLTAMEQLASRPWFSRLWTVQEVASATYAEVHCGSHRVSWDVFHLLGRMLCDLRDVVWDINNARHLMDEPFSPCVLLWFLVVTARRKCSLEKDRVYGIQSITNLTTDELPSLGHELHHSEVFIQLAEHCLTTQTPALSTTGRVQFNVPHAALLLALAPKTASADNRLPSWVPDWNNVPDTAQHTMLEYSGYLSDLFRLGPSHEYRFATLLQNENGMECYTKDSGQTLSIKGHCFGEILELFQASEYPFPRKARGRDSHDAGPPAGALSEDKENWYHTCRTAAARYWPPHDFNIKLKELLQHASQRSDHRGYCRSMLGHEPHQRYVRASLPLPTTRQSIYDATLPSLMDEKGEIDPHKLAIWTCGVLDRFRGELNHLRDRRLCALQSGSGEIALGWVPQTAKVGDRVCLFVGAPRPLILRPHGEGQGAFVLLGDSWVHGMCELDIADFCHERKDDLEWIDLR